MDITARLTSSPWGFRFYPFDKYARFMKSIGITRLCMMFGNPETFTLSVAKDEAAIDACLRAATNLGVSILEISHNGQYEQEIPLAARLGAKFFRFCSVYKDDEATRAKLLADLKAAGRIAADHNITVILENHGGLLTKPSECRRLLEEVGLDNVKLNYDPANFLFYGDDPLASLDEVLPQIGFTHFKSVRYVAGKGEYCRIKDGVIDYKAIFARLLPEYDGDLGLEYETPEDAEAGTRDDLESVLAAIG